MLRPSNMITQTSLIELHMLIEEKRPQLPNYPRRPFKDVLPNSSSTESSQHQSIDVPELLIELDDIDMSNDVGSVSAASSRAQHTIEFRIDDRVQTPSDMYFADKKQKEELPYIIGERYSCEVKLSDDDRLITISGHNNASVSTCASQLRQMQEYYLRPRFSVDRVALVYGSSRDEFRLQFVPVDEHSYYSTHLKYLPSSFRRINIGHLCVIEKATFDPHRSVWVLPGSVRLAPYNQGMPKGSNPQTLQQNWNRGAYYPQKQASLSSPNSNREWHEQDSPEFGFGPAKESLTMDKPSRQSTWKQANPQVLQQPRSQSAWQSSGPSGGQKFRPVNSSQSRVIQRMAQPEWSAQLFEDRKEEDFPVLGGSPKSITKMGASSALSSGHKPKVHTGSPNSSGDNPWGQNSGGISSTGNSIVFGDRDIAYLESLHDRRSAKSPQNENNNDGLALVNLRDPVKEREDSHRVFRSLPNQKATPGSPLPQQIAPHISFINGMRSYNMRRLSESIRNGLKELRGQRKEIRLVGRLGCVLYPIDGYILNKFWEYTQLESMIVRERDIRPIFSPIATTDKRNFDNLFGFLGHHKSETANFEIECDTRINPSSRFESTIVSVPSTIAILDRVVTPWSTYGEVIWNAVEKHMDFEILLQAREGTIRDTKSALGRTDVKPFSSFRKSISIGHITCQDMKPLLEVRGINFRRTLTYENPGQFTVVVHQIEELELTRTGTIDSVTGRTLGNGKKWFEFEVYNEVMSNKLRSNLTLIPGTVAEWTVEDIIGQSQDNSEELVEMVKSLMLLVDKCQEVFTQ
ncbi:hypothetical protein BGZ76_008396 [Entomortierella beljakovae]|nr:hypothetical protein BGZ76_008396 [Entomortierella beljakovae]